MEEQDLQNCLKFDDHQIKSLELPTLRKISIIYDCKHREVSKHLEKLERDRNELKQTLDGIKFKKLELEKLSLKMKQIYNDLNRRANKAEQELGKATIMCPIYQFQMSQFLEEVSPHKIKSGCPDVPLNWSVAEENLIKQKQRLTTEINYKQQMINEFSKKYLE